MLTTTAVSALRHSAKRVVSRDEFRWLGKPARQIWYYMRLAGEISRFPAVMSELRGNIRSKPIGELIDFVFYKFDGLFRPFQNPNELRRLVERVAQLQPSSVVEIGTARGGTLFLLSCVSSPSARIISIDLPAGPYGGGYPSWKGNLYRKLVGPQQSLHLIRGNSHHKQTFITASKLLNGDKVDLLFIDGDHSYAGAKQDFIAYREMVRPGGLIVFHDILENKHDKDITVAPLWLELRQQYQTDEIVDSYDQGHFGVGVLYAPEHW